MFNKVIIVGRLTRDIEIRYTQSGAAVGSCAIASSRKFKVQTGETKEEVMFIDITFFGRNAEIANQFTRKGSKILIEGILKNNEWTGRDGIKRNKHTIDVSKIVMLDTKEEGEKLNNEGGEKKSTYEDSQNTTKNKENEILPEIDINEDDIPF